MSEEEYRERRSTIEQHIGTILQIAVVGLLGWSLLTIQGMSKDMEVLKVKVESMNSTMTQGTTDRYRGTDAARDFAAIRQELQFLEKRLNAVESKVK
jgi:hypothetical protein